VVIKPPLQNSRLTGRTSTNALLALARMIIGDSSLCRKESVADKSLAKASLLRTERHQSSMDHFLECYVRPLHCTSRFFSTPEYTSLVQMFVRNFMDDNLELKVFESSFQDPRFRRMPGRGSFADSYTSTMISTPCSSWSGFRSTYSLSQYISTSYDKLR
jgi:hypothetical protein